MDDDIDEIPVLLATMRACACGCGRFGESAGHPARELPYLLHRCWLDKGPPA